ncbi:methyl-accepting chemotaxis protein [Bacillus sp. mrc49]|uniref:methyl-accepting chemotaxis protein n=1 Tax=Bacillus sp. mrc49 TaxID=2054913 RepID=UPI000C27BA5F|nr:methyl-accepting chemotaxis protein [Bacillus sp. mrc49]PJN89110.1 methyl-accepting chemotaxis protein [Bacillus sp. mrc49]
MKFSIKKKLIMSSMLISIIFGVSAFISYTSMKEMNKDYDYIIDNITEVNTNAQSIQNEATRQVSYIRGYLLYGTSEMKENVYTSNEKINQLIAQAKDISSMAETDRQLEDIQESNAAWIAENTKLIEVAAKDVNEAKKLAQEKVVPISTKLGEQTYALNESTEGVIKAKVKEAKEQSEKATDKILIISIFAFIFAIAAGWLTANLISKPLKKLGAAANQVAEGNLMVERIELKSRDELSELNQSFEKMTKHLRDTLTAISANAGMVAASADQLSSSVNQSSIAAETVATSIQEISGASEKTTKQLEGSLGTLNEVVQGIVRISDSTSSVAELSRESAMQAEEGSHFVEENLNQMRFIHESVNQSNQVIGSLSDRSHEIGKIIEVITGIAGQTNLLALNAAIEAARAGEHGKGFAVVAEEVRKLAEQSQTSTKLIADLINGMQNDTRDSVNIMKKVMENAEEGVKVSVETSNKFSQILDSTRSITPKIEEIKASVQQISASIDEVAQVSNDMTAHAQENAANSEEVAASTEEQLASMEEVNSSIRSLSSMAEELEDMVGKFNIK